ncbi:ABC transporter substrate-binding protein [uncultured Mailhella sp.]|uniref:ABC transporter substrate-binding protein n=1 Tax=uncultured Mailhella sp. TaxID=1981031 RepID=UPI0025E554B2|nr:ABC transporter substrate-binding protein [uncultured Mailhella sp.]
MIPRFRLALLLALCFALLSSGCTLLEKQRLPYHPQDESTLWVNSIAGLSGMEQGLRAEAVLKNPASSPALRARALSIAASRPGRQGFAARKELASLYASAGAEQRSTWETLYWTDLDGMDSDSLKALASKVSSEQETRFPWNLVMLKAARRNLLPESAAVIARLSNPMLYAAPSMLGIAPLPPGQSTISVALVVPQTGSASALGKQVAAGALAAADSLRFAGKTVDVRIIDSGQTGWQQAVQALPAQFTVVGGPLLPGRYKALKAAAAGRAVFSFTASLPAGEEGVHAWRFFASQDDQIDALLNGAEELGISSFGIFSPGDSYSRRMSGLFMQKATARGCTVTSGSYTAGKMNAWTREAGTFVKTQVGAQRGSIPVATADFKAIFLPDSWKNMDMLVSSLHYNGAQDRLMMGTSLWEQNLGHNSHSNTATFALTIFPGVWDDHSSTPGATAFKSAMAARGARADDWSSLGFDFVSMAADLNLQPGWSAQSVNHALAARPDVDWAGAPIFWDASGKASRKLFLFQPAATGHAPADLQKLKARLESGDVSTPAPETPAAPQRPVSFEQLVNSLSKD